MKYQNKFVTWLLEYIPSRKGQRGKKLRTDS